MDLKKLHQIAYDSILELSTGEGINASGKDDVYGCIFGRDSAITILKILRSCERKRDKKLLEICHRGLMSLITLQGKESNPESGEEPGKFIHEYRKDNIERLLNLDTKPWYVYPDRTIRNYDSLDSTALSLIAIYRYWEVNKSHDKKFLITVMPAVEAGLNWLITYGDRDKDGLLEYESVENRKHGGLVVQSWTDSHESIRQKNGKLPKYPIAPCEVQGYAWLALKLWGNFYLQHSPTFGQKLLIQAVKMKRSFNKTFIFKDNDLYFVAQALDGNKNLIKTVTGNPLLLLWATYKKECILENRYIDDIVKRSFASDMFDPEAGIRTMSTQSPTFNPNQDSYHNGSFWPVLNGMAEEGLENWHYNDKAEDLKLATLKPMAFFGTPIELYIKTDDSYTEWRNAEGQAACKVQAWSAAVMLDLLTNANSSYKIKSLVHNLNPRFIFH